MEIETGEAAPKKQAARQMPCAVRSEIAKQTATQWDHFMPSVWWAYCNTPHKTTGEKPSALLFGYDCQTPSEVALLPQNPTTVSDYREQVIKHDSAIKLAQVKYKKVI